MISIRKRQKMRGKTDNTEKTGARIQHTGTYTITPEREKVDVDRASKAGLVVKDHHKRHEERKGENNKQSIFAAIEVIESLEIASSKREEQEKGEASCVNQERNPRGEKEKRVHQK